MRQKKLNNKGITLVELIVSFVIVAVAVIYFYQMLTSVTKMYANAREDINHSAKVNYAFRLLDEAYSQDKLEETCSGVLSDVVNCDGTVYSKGKFDIIKFSVEKDEKEKKYSLYKYSG